MQAEDLIEKLRNANLRFPLNKPAQTKQNDDSFVIKFMSHQVIQEIKKQVAKINSFFDEGSDIEFFKVANYDGNTLRLYAGRDLTFAHNFELIFEKVSFFKGDFEWSRNDESELILIEEISEKPGELRFKFVLQSDGYYFSNHNHRIEIWAESIDFDPSTVYYWNKEDLKEGERVAEWVNRNKKG